MSKCDLIIDGGDRKYKPMSEKERLEFSKKLMAYNHKAKLQRFKEDLWINFCFVYLPIIAIISAAYAFLKLTS